MDGGTYILLKLNVAGGNLLHQLLQGRSITIILHRLCRWRCSLLELLLLLSKRRSLVFAGGRLKLLLSEWLLLLWTRIIPQILMVSPTKIIGAGVRIILLLLRSEWLSRLHGRNIHLLDDQKHNRYHISAIAQWLATSQGMSTL